MQVLEVPSVKDCVELVAKSICGFKQGDSVVVSKKVCIFVMDPHNYDSLILALGKELDDKKFILNNGSYNPKISSEWKEYVKVQSSTWRSLVLQEGTNIVLLRSRISHVVDHVLQIPFGEQIIFARPTRVKLKTLLLPIRNKKFGCACDRCEICKLVSNLPENIVYAIAKFGFVFHNSTNSIWTLDTDNGLLFVGLDIKKKKSDLIYNIVCNNKFVILYDLVICI